MAPRSIALGSLLLVAAAGCAEAPPVQWRGPSGQGPPLGETSDCRVQARRQAELRYPASASAGRRPPLSAATPDAFDRSASEAALYNRCLEQRGYRLVEVR